MADTLIDLSIDKNKTMADASESDSIVESIDVDDKKIIVSTILGEYNSLVIGSLSELNSKSIKEFISKDKLENIHFPEKIIDALQEIKLALDMAWSSQHSMYRLRYNMDENGQIKSLYVPMDTEYVDDIKIKQIRDKDGNFMADTIKDNMGDKLYRLESADLFVDDIENPTQIREARIRKKEDIASRELSSNSIEDEIIKLLSTFFVCILPILISPMSSILYSSSSNIISSLGILTTLICFTYILSGAWYFLASMIGSYINNIIEYKRSMSSDRSYCVYVSDV